TRHRQLTLRRERTSRRELSSRRSAGRRCFPPQSQGTCPERRYLHPSMHAVVPLTADSGRPERSYGRRHGTTARRCEPPFRPPAGPAALRDAVTAVAQRATPTDRRREAPEELRALGSLVGLPRRAASREP